MWRPEFVEINVVGWQEPPWPELAERVAALLEEHIPLQRRVHSFCDGEEGVRVGLQRFGSKPMVSK